MLRVQMKPIWPSQNLLSWKILHGFNVSIVQCPRERPNLQLMFCIIRRPLQMPLSTTAPTKRTFNYYECSTIKQMFHKTIITKACRWNFSLKAYKNYIRLPQKERQEVQWHENLSPYGSPHFLHNESFTAFVHYATEFEMKPWLLKTPLLFDILAVVVDSLDLV